MTVQFLAPDECAGLAPSGEDASTRAAAVAAALAQLSRGRRTGLDVQDKIEFLKYFYQLQAKGYGKNK